MKICFVGSLINGKTLDEIVAKSKVKPSNAPVNFENMLVKGLDEAGADVTVLSLPTVSTYPHGSLFSWGRKREKLDFEKDVIWLPCINVMGLKQFTARVSSFYEILRWAIRNRDDTDKVIMNYSVYPPYSRPTQLIGKFFKIKTCCVVSDLPQYLYRMHESKGVKAYLNELMSHKMVDLQGKFDSYVFLTKHMPKKMNIEKKPGIVVEGFSDAMIFDGIDVPKSDKKSIMYAGALSKSFNVDSLLEGFMQTKSNFELWLFGYGDLIDYIHECEQKDKRIKYFGKVDRKVLLEHEKAAHLLISVKSPAEDHANYAFPSKILEYMTSGTAVASTRVGGIPEEYFQYIFPIRDESSESIRNSIEEIMNNKDDFLFGAGQKAYSFSVNSKNYVAQCSRITRFLQRYLERNNG